MNDKRDDNDGREKFSEWIVAARNESFPAVIANRMWKRVMGKGLYEPVDEYKPAGQNPPPAAGQAAGRELMVEF
jgi:hypothetical protein